MSRSKLVCFAAASATALLCAQAVFAAETSADAVAELDKVTVTATRSEKKLQDAPVTASVISSEEIEDGLIKDIKDLVRFEPGVSVRSAPARFTAAGASTGRDGNAGFNIRGLEGNRVLILVDGVRVPDGYAFGAQNMGRGDYVDLDLLKSVEIVRGPASALYGSDGLAGSVNFFTKDPSDLLKAGKAFSLRARAGYASADESWTESLVAAGQQGRWEGLVAYTRRDGEGQKTAGTNDAANTDRTTANPEDSSSNAVLARVVYNLSDQNRFRLTYDHLDRDVDWTVLSAIAKPPLAATSVLGLTAFDRMKRDRVTLDHRFTGGQGLIRSATTTLYYQNSTTRQYSAEDRNTAVDRTRDASFDNEVFGAALELKSEAAFGGVTHRIVWGGDASITRQEGIRNGTVPPAGEVFPTRAFPTTDYTLAGVYAQDEIALGPVTFYPAVRYDYYKLEPKRDALFTANLPASQSDSHLSPKLGVVWKATDLVTVFANAAAGFKAPSPSQVNNGFANLASNYMSISNPDLKPETSETFELGIRLNRARWNASVTGFTGKYDDFIEQVQVRGAFTPTDPAVYQYVNLAKAEITGTEARAAVELGAGFTLQGAASYARGNSETNGRKTPLTSIDPVKLVAGLGYRDPAGKFGGQLSAVHSARESASRAGVSCSKVIVNPPPAPPTTLTGSDYCWMPKAFTVFDLTAYWNLTDNVTLRGGVFNITGQTYAWWSDVRGLADSSTVKDAYTQPDRNYSVSLAVKF
ncbi:TonB-dependent heme/hemoglobin/transferrin/lactoferrin receptor family protein [Caulobacter sp. AP07]|uniref:TonB-dependent hemoglobin/transferrin/lactoferrin family receptor n=1 Tax=Caulobacter sp. AP07 TaxID=1144304 RepID=UPI000271E874|nr:TonB-dependent hemoglobin/transferrin/lactoferrin family receptor [Caulobacter sp. AP07]EJL34246.1 TonB-dependent heme/hemoglobin/transferrin/lactoferrin receptor family protein [Caulobacter sp. AP07]